MLLPRSAKLIDRPNVCRFGRSINGSQRHAQNRVRAETRLVRRSVKLDQQPIDRLLISGVLPDQRRMNFRVHIFDSFANSESLQTL